jgi:hypothetical protein
MIGGIGCLFKLRDLLFKVLEVLLLALPERSLRSTVLGFPLL